MPAATRSPAQPPSAGSAPRRRWPRWSPSSVPTPRPMSRAPCYRSTGASVWDAEPFAGHRRPPPDPHERTPTMDRSAAFEALRKAAVDVLSVEPDQVTEQASFADDLWETPVAPRPAAGPITLYDASDHSVGFACEVRDFDAVPYVGPKEVRRTDRTALLGLAAATDAVADACATSDAADGSSRALDDPAGAGDLGADPLRCAVVGGSGIGGIRTLEDQVIGYAEKGPSRVGPFLVPMMMPNATAALVGIRHGFTGPNLAIATACATGAHAIGEGARMVRDGTADVGVCGGAEGCVSPLA